MWLKQLVGGLVAINFIFPLILGISFIIPIDELHHFSEGWLEKPPTSSGYYGQFIEYIYIHVNTHRIVV